MSPQNFNSYIQIQDCQQKSSIIKHFILSEPQTPLYGILGFGETQPEKRCTRQILGWYLEYTNTASFRILSSSSYVTHPTKTLYSPKYWQRRAINHTQPGRQQRLVNSYQHYEVSAFMYYVIRVQEVQSKSLTILPFDKAEHPGTLEFSATTFCKPCNVVDNVRMCVSNLI